MKYVCVYFSFISISVTIFKHVLHISKLLTLVLKNNMNIRILVGHTVLELLVKMCKTLFWWITQESLGLIKFQCPYWVSLTICFRKLVTIFKHVLHISKLLTLVLKNNMNIRILVGHTVLELLVKMCKTLFWWITQESLGLIKFQCPYWVSLTICFRKLVSFFKKSVTNTEHAINYGLG